MPAERAFGTKSGTNLSRTDKNSAELTLPGDAEDESAEPAV
jgi:hypothetical protein